MNLGSKHSDTARKKMSETSKRLGHIPPSRKGIKHSEETKIKIRNNTPKIWLGKKRPKETVDKIIKKLRGRLLGKSAWNWKGGISSKNQKIRSSGEYKLWRRANYERDNYTCQKYGTRGGELVVHHINNFADNENLRFAIDNGITLSLKAHEEFHKKYGKHNNTKEQLIEFLIK